jgi:hypothetical protein
MDPSSVLGLEVMFLFAWILRYISVPLLPSCIGMDSVLLLSVSSLSAAQTPHEQVL